MGFDAIMTDAAEIVGKHLPVAPGLSLAKAVAVVAIEANKHFQGDSVAVDTTTEMFHEQASATMRSSTPAINQ